MKVKTLLAVIESGSYTKAAQKLNLTQSAVRFVCWKMSSI